MEEAILKIVTNWLSEPLAGSTRIKKVTSAIEDGQPIIYASIKFVLIRHDNSRREVTEESRIPFGDISEADLIGILDALVERIFIE